jgi:hypothetical protein
MKRVNLIGKRFGKLTVIAKADRTDKGNNQYWLCKCGCGNYKEIRGNHLNSGNTKTCGCLRKLPEGESSFNQLIGFYKYAANARGLPFKLSRLQFRKLTKENCIYCGKQPSQVINRPKHNGVYIYNGVDRINPKLGYIIDNCVPCCGMCNRMKSDLSYKEFCQHIKQIYDTITTVD